MLLLATDQDSCKLAGTVMGLKHRYLSTDKVTIFGFLFISTYFPLAFVASSPEGRQHFVFLCSGEYLLH